MKLKLENITYSYNRHPLLEGIDLSVRPGQILSVIGPSGAGKTTLLKLISGQLRPEAGRIMIDGQDMTGVPPEKRNVGFVFQSPLLFPHMTVTENICFGLEVQKCPQRLMDERSRYLLKLLKLEDLGHRKPYEISGGQQQRAAIARALAPAPKLLLMDEPFSNLDPALRYEMGNLIKELQAETGVTIVFVTHDREESMLLSHEIAVLMAGRILQTASPQKLYYEPETLQVGEYMGRGNALPGRIENGCFISPQTSFSGIELSVIQPENTNGWLYLRPHQLELDPDKDDYRIIERQVIGKTSLYLVGKDMHQLYVEAYSDTLSDIGASIGVRLKPGPRHFIPEGRVKESTAAIVL